MGTKKLTLFYLKYFTCAPKLLSRYQGLGSHDMMEEKTYLNHTFQKGLSKLAPILNELAQVSEVIWLNEYPTLDFYGTIESFRTSLTIHSEKMDLYNDITRNTFKQVFSFRSNLSTICTKKVVTFMINFFYRNYEKIKIWDSSNHFAEEYIRGCYYYPRDATVKIFADSYTKCQDYIHTGNVALFPATQVLLNNFCNSHMDKIQL